MAVFTDEQPESRFRLALKRLIGAGSDEETKAAILDLEESLRLILEKRDKEWSALLQERSSGTPAYAPDLKSFATDIAREVTASVDARIDAKVARARGSLPQTPASSPTSPITLPSDTQQKLDSLQEQITAIREIVKGELQPDVKAALAKEARSAIGAHIDGDDELSRMIAELVKELKDQLTAELKAELTAEIKEAIKDEIKKELL